MIAVDRLAIDGSSQVVLARCVYGASTGLFLFPFTVTNSTVAMAACSLHSADASGEISLPARVAITFQQSDVRCSADSLATAWRWPEPAATHGSIRLPR